MSLQGSLQQLSLGDVLQNALAGRQGNLYLRKGVHRALLHIETNLLYLVEPDTLDAESMLQGLLHRGVLDPLVYAGVQEPPRPASDLLEHLVDEGLLPRPEVDAMLRGAAEDSILDLLTWQSGDFRFKEGEEAPPSTGLVAKLGIDMGGMLLRAAQRIDERNAIATALGLEAHLFVPLATTPTPEDVDDPVAEVHALLDGQRVVDEIAMLLGITRFATLRAVLACVQTGCARLPTPEELRVAADARRAGGHPRVARRLLLQWTEIEPTSVEPLQRLVALARENRQPEEEGDALLTLGHVHLQLANGAAAVPILRDVLAKRPGDERALAALASAAEATGDLDLYGRCVIQLAEGALQDDEPARAAQLLARLVSVPDAPIAARVIRARAFVQMRDHERLLAEAEAFRQRLGRKCRRRDELEAASFFRSSIATLAPERTDLLRQFRSMSEGTSPIRRVALIAALLLLIATAGFVLWPESPASLLEKAQAAAAAGNTTEALQWVTVLTEQHPDAPETGEAFLLQARLQDPGGAVSRTPQVTKDSELEIALVALEEALPRLPAPEATAQVKAVEQILAQHDNARFRCSALTRLEKGIVVAADRIVQEIRLRSDLLAQAGKLAAKSALDREPLTRFLEKTDAYLADDYAQHVAQSVSALDSLVDHHRSEADGRAVRLLDEAVERLQRMSETQASSLDICHRRLTRLEVDDLYTQCRTEASRLLVAGRLDAADACYTALEDKVASLAGDSRLTPLLEEVAKRRIPEFIADRRAMISEIRQGLQGAKAAEEAGDLAAAVKAYIAVARRFWHIRFENVIRLPMRVTSVPVGARVRINGEDAGVTPVIVHYPWATQITVTVDAPAYETATHVVMAGETNPPSEVALPLAPQDGWRAPIASTVTISPLGVRQDVLVCDRGGRVILHAGDDGRVRWARHIKSLEGVRARPVVSGGRVYVPFIDGTAWVLDLRDGQPLGSVNTGRPVVEPAVLGNLVAIATLSGRLVVIRRMDIDFSVSLGGHPTAGVLAAHGAFWVGVAEGNLVRVAADGTVRSIPLPGRPLPVLGLAAFDGGLAATKADGTLHLLNSLGRSLWHADAIGSVVGTPAVAQGVVAVIDAQGRVLLFDQADATPRGQIDLGGNTHFGITTADGLFATCLDNGRLWIYDPAGQHTLADVDLGGTARFAIADVGGKRLAVPASGGTLRILALPPHGDEAHE